MIDHRNYSGGLTVRLLPIGRGGTPLYEIPTVKLQTYIVNTFLNVFLHCIVCHKAFFHEIIRYPKLCGIQMG